MAPRRTFRSVPSRTRRKSAWGVGPNTGTDGTEQTISAAGVFSATAGALVLADGATLVRTRGELVLNLLSTTSAGDGFIGAFGIGVATSQAFGAGAASMPAPVTEDDWDGWLYHRFFSITAGGILDTGVASARLQVMAAGASLRVEVDSKAMRKTPQNMTIFAAIEVVEAGAATMAWFFNSRLLFKLA